MKRLRVVPLICALCLLVALGAMAWISWTAMRLERTEAEAWERAETEERVRLALWRMDSSVTPLLTQEIARPETEYRAFYSTGQAYGKQFQNIPKGEILVPSPLLSFRAAHIHLHFQISPSGKITSPQVPTGNMRDVAEASGHTTTETVNAAMEQLEQLKEIVRRESLAAMLPLRSASVVGALCAPVGPQVFVPLVDTRSQSVVREQDDAYRQVAQKNVQVWSNSRRGDEWSETQVARNDVELQERMLRCEPLGVGQQIESGPNGFAADIPADMMRPLWTASELLLARRVNVDGVDLIQGCWLDWGVLEKMLLGGVADLLPAAQLEAAGEEARADGARLLASLPVRVVPGPVTTDAVTARSPVFFSLGIAWMCVLIAAVSVLILVVGAIALSERRRGFVSAVTHEMRTPLTTFRLYTEMLSEGMVADESKRQSYLMRLRTEADRLGHLVENVLAYAGLESGRVRREVERVEVGQVVSRVRDRLTDRAGQAEMTLNTSVDDAVATAPVDLDLSAVEQILLNLVDNACKYANGTEDRRVHLDVTRDGGFVLLAVRDHGPGISREGAKRLFRPFSKSVDEAARSAPGVGLGLSLSRRFAREMGGDLGLDQGYEGGAAFVLRLPLAR